MSKDKYFVISTGEDGASIECIDKDDLLSRLDKGYHYGKKEFLTTEVTNEGDFMYLGESLLIIKGEIVTPKPVEVVKKWEV